MQLRNRFHAIDDDKRFLVLDSGEHLYDAGDVGVGTGWNKGLSYGLHLDVSGQVLPKCQSHTTDLVNGYTCST